MVGVPFVVSVIVPVYNDPRGIATTLEALTRQTFAKTRYEIIVCDNGSSGETRDVVRAFQRRHPDLIRLVVEDKQQGSYAARNKGISNASGEILAFLDADMWMGEDWLARVVDKMQDESMDYLGCNVEIVTTGESLVGRYNATFGFPVETYLRESHYAPTCCLVVRESVFEKVGLFDATLVSGGDKLFGRLVYECGIEQHYADDMTLYHPARTSLQSLARKYFRIGRGNRQVAHGYGGGLQGERLSASSFFPLRPLAYRRMVNETDNASGLDWKQHLVFFAAMTCAEEWARSAGYAYEVLSECWSALAPPLGWRR